MSKVKVAILGCGGMAAAHAWRFRDNPDAQIVALCDLNCDALEAFRAKHLPEYSPPQLFDDAAQMYAQAKPDAVSIVTPHTMHFEHAMQALDAGCHVLIEKPMVTHADDAHRLATRARETGKIVTIGYNTPCTPAFHYLREIIRSNELGALQTITGWQTQNWKKATTGTWRQQPELSGGGQMYDSGAHLLNSLVWSVEQDVDEVYAFVDNKETAVDIVGTVNIRFQGGVLAVISIDGNCPASSAGMHLTFDNGRVDIDGWRGEWIEVYKGSEKIEPVLQGKTNTPNDNFIDAILGREEARTCPKNGVIQSELMDAIYQSASTHQPVRPAAR